MKKLLRYLIIFLILIAIAAVALMYFSPKQMIFEESIEIEAPSTMVYNMVNDFKSWENWSPWADIDPNAVTTYTDKTSGVGAQFGWKGNKELGEGTQKIVESVKGEKIRTELQTNFFKGNAYSNWKFETAGSKTKVSWDMEGAETPFVFRPFNLLMKSGLKKTYRTGLERIKKQAEDRFKNKVYGGYKIAEVYQGAKHYVMNRQLVNFEDVNKFYTQNIASLFTKAQGVTMEMDGMPSRLFYSWDPATGSTDMAAALPLREPVVIPGAISQTVSDGKVIQVDYYGDPGKTQAAHRAISDYMNDNGLLINYPIVEESITDPAEEKDPEKWLTKITYYTTNSTQ